MTVITHTSQLSQLGTSLVIPLRPPGWEGEPKVFLVWPDDPTTPPFLWPPGTTPRMDAPSRCQAALTDCTVPLYVVFDPLQGDYIASQGLCAIATLGIYGEHPDWESVCLQGREVRLCLPAFTGAGPALLRGLTAYLESRGATVIWSPFEGPGWR